jgi:hypothetical protein
MPLYMTQAGYTSEACLGSAHPKPREPQRSLWQVGGEHGRSAALFLQQLRRVRSGCYLRSPDESTAAAIVLTAVSPGHLSSVKATVLLSAEEGMEAMRKAGEATYRAPGQQ